MQGFVTTYKNQKNDCDEIQPGRDKMQGQEEAAFNFRP